MNIKLAGLLGATLALAPLGMAQAMPIISSPVVVTTAASDGAVLEKTDYYGYHRGWHRGWHRPWGWHRRWHRHYY